MSMFSSIFWNLSIRTLFFAFRFQFLFRHIALEGQILFQQHIYIFLIDIETLHLMIWPVITTDPGSFVPFDTKPFQKLQLAFLATFYITLLVSILDPDHHFPIEMFCI